MRSCTATQRVKHLHRHIRNMCCVEDETCDSSVLLSQVSGSRETRMRVIDANHLRGFLQQSVEVCIQDIS